MEKKMKESGERRKQRRNYRPCLCIAERSDWLLQTLTLAYIVLRAREVTKQTKTKAITRVKIGRNKKVQQKSEASKSRNGQ